MYKAKILPYLLLSTLLFSSVVPTASAQANRGFVSHDGNQFIWSGSGEAFVPNLWMHYGYVTEGKICSSDAEKDRAISQAMDKNGFNGLHLGVMGQWFDCKTAKVSGADTTVDMNTINHLQTLINKVYAKGGMVHIWAWGDSSRSQSSRELPGGIMGPEERRVWDVVYEELNDVPGWTIGYGYDLNEWVSNRQLEDWVRYLESKPNWKHLTSARNSESVPGASGWLNQRTSHNDIASLQAHQPTYNHAVEALSRFRNRPVIFEDRFRIGLSGTFAWTTEATRRGLWHFTMAGGVAAIWGNMSAGPEISSYPNSDELRTFRAFWDGRFLRGMERANGLTNGYALRRGQDHYVFYKENTDRLTYRFSGGDKRAIAVNTREKYLEIDLGIRSAGEHVFAGANSDWAIAVEDASLKNSSGAGRRVIGAKVRAAMVFGPWQRQR